MPELQADEYRVLFDAMDEGYCVIEFFDGPHGPDSDYVHIAANDAYAENAGIPNVVGQKLREMVPDEADAWVERYGEVLRTGKPIRFVQELVATGRWLELSAFRIDPPERKHVAVLFRDISRRVRNERRMRLLDALSRETIGSDDPDDILAVTTRLTAQHMGVSNCAYADMDEDEDGFTIRGDWAEPGLPSIVGHYQLADFGRLAVERLGAGEPLIINDNRTEIAPEEAATFQAIGITATICMPLVKNGRLTALMAVHDKAARQWTDDELATIREVTERAWANVERVAVTANLRANEAELATLNAELESRVEERTSELLKAEEALRQAQKMEAVGQLTGGLAHDFNNLLAGISGAFEMISTRLQQGRPEDVDRYLTAGQGAARRAAALTHRLLAFARRQTLTPRPTVVNSLLPDLVELVHRTVGPAISVETVAASGLWPAMVDANQLENAILNLCINARDAMPTGGKITIETGNKWIDERAAAEHGFDAGQYVTICVSDTGGGIPKDVLPRVFDPFFTTKPLGEGTGLGLSMVYGFARQSNGHVRIYSEEGQGTMVCIYMPRHLGSESATERVSHSSSPARAATEGETVLVIDDEPVIRMLVVDALGEVGLSCLEAEDGGEGIAILESEQRVDLLITDVGLPGGLNGRQVADAARKLRPGLKILFITGYAENAVLNHGHIEPGMEVLTKPFAVDALTSRVWRMLEDDRAGI